MKTTTSIAIFWFRRDLRLDDNTGLFHALQSGKPVLPLFIFDMAILEELEPDDARVSFLHERLKQLDAQLQEHGSHLLVMTGKPLEVWNALLKQYPVEAVYANTDYEPYARRRDAAVEQLLGEKGIRFFTFKDQVIFDGGDVLKDDGNPYTVYTPYMKKWMARFEAGQHLPLPSEAFLQALADPGEVSFPSLESLGFRVSNIKVPSFDTSKALISGYAKHRDFPAVEGTSHIGPYLRFGLVGIRKLVQQVRNLEPTYWKELVWREFFMQILWHFPRVVDTSFREKYDRIPWHNNEDLFRRWCDGTTGYPLVDAGMRELRATGFMHNRVRMVTASFLCKHLLIDWRWGEAWFAKHLLDYELSSNNGNWQWAAGTGCDASPYFRVFNPESQLKKFDPSHAYVKKWVPERGTTAYPDPVVDHKMAREQAIAVYRRALQQ